MIRNFFHKWPLSILVLGVVVLCVTLFSSTGLISIVFISLLALGIAIYTDNRPVASTESHKEAVEVLSSLRSGNLKTRAQVKTLDSEGRFLQLINEVAEELESLVAKNKMLERSKTQWLQELAHDLRTPLASIELAQTALKKSGGKLNEDQKMGLIDDTINETHHLRVLVEDMMTLSLLEDSSYFSSRENIVLIDLFESVLMGYPERAKSLSKELILTFDKDEFLEKKISSNRSLLTRLIKNCIDNALAYSYSRIEICLKENKAKQSLIFSIKNDGANMSEEQMNNFGQQRKSRGDSKSEKLPTSLGLGSIIIVRSAKLLGAQFKIENVVLSNQSPGVGIEIIF